MPQSQSQNQSMQIVVASTFTADTIAPALSYWLNRLEIDHHIKFAPFDQIFQQLLAVDGDFGINRGGANVVLLRVGDWMGASHDKDAERKALDLADEFVSAASDGPGTADSDLIVCLCPTAEDVGSVEAAPIIKNVETYVAKGLSDRPGTVVLRSEDLIEELRNHDIYDSHAERLGAMPYTDLFFTAIGSRVARAVYGIARPEHKVLVLDCDDTLWAGICGELGANGVQIRNHHRFLQEFAIAQQQRGRLVCLASRNNESDVESVFRENSEMVLQEHHLTASKINWRPKSDNLAALSTELGLALDSFVFIDDDPVQCEEVRSRYPEVLTLRAPAGEDEAQNLLSHLWPFDPRPQTSESAGRTVAYRDHAKREQLRTETPSLRAFLDSLELIVDIHELTEAEVARATELSQRTNQFNLTSVRHTHSEIQTLRKQAPYELFAVRVQDRFGDYGLVGLIVCQLMEGLLRVPAFLLSCRALGRGVEHHMLRHLGEFARANQLDHIELLFKATERNMPAEAFLRSLNPNEWRSSNSSLRLSVTETVRLEPKYDSNNDFPDVKDSGELEAAPDNRTSGVKRVEALIDAATRLSDVRQLHREIHGNPAAHEDEVSEGDDPVHSMLTAAFSNLLGLDQFDDDEGFFELGGHSLQAVQVLAQASQSFDIELDPTLLFTTNFSIAELKEEIEHLRAAKGSFTGVSGLLDQISEMTD